MLMVVGTVYRFFCKMNFNHMFWVCMAKLQVHVPLASLISPWYVVASRFVVSCDLWAARLVVLMFRHEQELLHEVLVTGCCILLLIKSTQVISMSPFVVKMHWFVSKRPVCVTTY
jgi:hypothetical protein